MRELALRRLSSYDKIIIICMLQFNLTHHIRHLSFGHEYPGIKHPLDNTYVAAEDRKSQIVT